MCRAPLCSSVNAAIGQQVSADLCLVWKVSAFSEEKKDAIQPFFMLARKTIMVMWVRDEILDWHTAPFSMWKSQISEMWIKEKRGHFIYGRTLLLQQEWETLIIICLKVDDMDNFHVFFDWNPMTWMTFVHILLIVVLHQTIVQVYCFGSLLLMSRLLLLYVLLYQHCFLFIFKKKLIKKKDIIEIICHPYKSLPTVFLLSW